MPDARARGWGDPGQPGSGQERAYRSAHLTTITAGGVRLLVRREVALLFKGFLDEIIARGYRLDVDVDDWGFANRDIRGRPGVKSNHSWGLAVDINARANPMTQDGRLRTDMPPWVAELAARYGLMWGGNYSGRRKDPMHFEFLGTPADVARYIRLTPLAQPVKGEQVGAPPQPEWTIEEGDVKTKQMSIGPLDGQGNGWASWDPGLGRTPILVGEIKLGPHPQKDGGYVANDDWKGQRDAVVLAQPRENSVIVTVQGGKPGGRLVCFVSVA